MATKPLSAAQVKALEYVRETQAGYHWGMWSTDVATVRTWNGLERDGLVNIAYCCARLTEQGRAALAAHKLVEHHRAGDVRTLVDMVAKENAESEE